MYDGQDDVSTEGAASDAIEDPTVILSEPARLSHGFDVELKLQQVGRYVLYQRIGRGGFGVVYAAYDPELDRRVAIKLVPDRQSHDGVTSVLEEARALARLSHPNVVGIYDVGTLGDTDTSAADVTFDAGSGAPERWAMPMVKPSSRGVIGSRMPSLMIRK